MSEQKGKAKLPHYSSPLDYAGFLDRIVLALFNLSKPSTSKEIREKDAKLPAAQATGRGAAFLVYLGLAQEKGGRNMFELIGLGREIGVNKVQGKEEAANKLWQEALTKHPLYGYIKDYIADKGGGVQGSPIGLGDYLRQIAQADWSPSFYREGGKRLCQLYASKGLLAYDQAKDTFTLAEFKPIVQPPPTPPAQPPGGGGPIQVPPLGAGQTVNPPVTSPGLTATVSIEVKVDTRDDKSVSNLIDVIRALRGEKVERGTKGANEEKKEEETSGLEVPP